MHRRGAAAVASSGPWQGRDGGFYERDDRRDLGDAVRCCECDGRKRVLRRPVQGPCPCLAEAQSAVGASFGVLRGELGAAGRAVGLFGVEVGCPGRWPKPFLFEHAITVLFVDSLSVCYIFTRDREPRLCASTRSRQRAREARDALLVEQLLDLADVGGVALKQDLGVRRTGHGLLV